MRQEVLANLQEFFRLFADQCHHGKEEELLFPLLEQKGIPRTGGPIGVTLHEHEEGRALVRQMGDAVEATKSEPERARGGRGPHEVTPACCAVTSKRRTTSYS